MVRGYKSFSKIKLNDKNDYIKIYKNGDTKILKSNKPTKEEAHKFLNHRTYTIYKQGDEIFLLNKEYNNSYMFKTLAIDQVWYSFRGNKISRVINNTRKQGNNVYKFNSFKKLCEWYLENTKEDNDNG